MEEALQRVRAMAHAPCQNLKEKMSVYSNWSEHYDEDVSVLKYSAPTEAVKTLCDVIDADPKLDPSCDVIDFAAGTGWVAKCLRERGFTGNFDAQDGSAAMLERAKHLYRNTYCCILEQGVKLPTELSSSYEVAIMCGALSDSQVEASCLGVIISTVRSNGLIVLTTRLNPSNLQYVERLENEMKLLERNGVWELVQKRSVEEFELATDDNEKVSDSGFIPGVVYCYRKL